MISRKQWVVLFAMYLIYLLAGGSVFLHLEAEHEIQNERTLLQLQKKLSVVVFSIREAEVRQELEEAIQELASHLGEDLLVPGVIIQSEKENGLRVARDATSRNSSLTEDALNSTLINELGNSTEPDFSIDGNQFDNLTSSILVDADVILEFPEDDIEASLMWNLWNAFFFSFTAITTIGFGHMYPKTDEGQFFCILYSLFGVPFNGIVFAGLADLFSSKFIKKVDSGRYKKKWKIVLDSCFYLVPGLFVLMVLPSLIIMFLEDWSFLGAFYFAFITLTTIGFGDYVAGYPDWMSGPWVWVYRACIMAWICFGLGYLLMVIAFIQRALRSEGFRKIDRSMKKVLQKRVDATSSHIRTDLERIRNILITISKARTKDSRKSSSQDSQEEIPKKEERANDAASLTNREVTNVEILLELAESVMAAKSSPKPEEDPNRLNHMPHDDQLKAPLFLSFQGQSWEDNHAYEQDPEKGTSSLMKRKFSNSLSILRRTSLARLPPPPEEPDIHSLGDVLDHVEDILQKDSASSIVDKAEHKRRAISVSSGSRRNSDTMCHVDGDGAVYLKDQKRRYTLATLLAR